jgi:hypothetical protein
VRHSGAQMRPSAPPSVIRRDPDAARAPSKAKKGWGKIASTVEKSKSFNEGKTPSKKSASSAKTVSAGGAWLASQVGSQEKIGSVDDYMGSRDDAESAQSKHLSQFLGGGHAFITPWVHKQIWNLNEDGSGWGGWGRDANFIAPLGEADALVAKASAPGARGIWDLEVALGIPEGQWVKGCAPDYHIFRYLVRDPVALGLRIPSGNESGAYGSWWNKDKYQAGQWEPGGETEGGAAEAVIDKISLDKLSTLGKDVFEVIEEKAMAANTKRVADEKKAAGGSS